MILSLPSPLPPLRPAAITPRRKRPGKTLMEELVQRVRRALGVDAETAQSAIRAVFSFLNREGPEAEMAKLVAAIEGAEDYVGPTPDQDAVTLGGLGGLMGGGIMEILGALQGLGLDIGQIQTLGEEIFGFAREKVGTETTDRLVRGTPGLSQFL
ncbi:DUF2267 domain-containing protein [Afifella sp. H1R]|uniref:DUF2267 domain-containing protein n=1 Tax=Afifella sp. H1R TaxID=2908841 RepID=UPI0021036B37|nr:DUF2267 domain-containing protein [Afifella sp. H1R]